MKKNIEKALLRLKLTYAFLWTACISLTALYETECLPTGTLTDDARTEYAAQSAGILLTVTLIPLALRIFNLPFTRRISKKTLNETLKSYCRWNDVRIALLLTAALINLSTYYATFNTTGLLCAAMALIASLFCVPGKNRMMYELQLEPSTLQDK